MSQAADGDSDTWSNGVATCKLFLNKTKGT